MGGQSPPTPKVYSLWVGVVSSDLELWRARGYIMKLNRIIESTVDDIGGTSELILSYFSEFFRMTQPNKK